MNKRDYPPRIRQLLEAQGYFALTTEERIAKHEEAMRVLAGIDRGMDMELRVRQTERATQDHRWLICLRLLRRGARHVCGRDLRHLAGVVVRAIRRQVGV